MADDRRDFFISFNSADLAHAKAIDEALRTEGFTTYYAPNDLPPGGNVPAWMEESLMNSNQTLALFSPDYLKDKAVYSFAERYASWWRDVRGDDRKIIPILLREVDFKKLPIMAMFSRIECTGKNPKDAAAHIVENLKSPVETKQRSIAQLGENLPEIFHVLYRPNASFTGRFEDLDSLQNSLRTGNAAVTALAGTGGIGKTTLAAEYCHRFGSRYAGVWWMRSEQESVLLQDIVDLGTRLKLEQSGNIEKDARACVEYLTTRPEPWLLVFDNAPDTDRVRHWLPAGKARSIITSRRSDFDAIAKVTKLDQWSEETTTDYLLSRTERTDKEGAQRLAKILGGLPLAAEQAAAFLHTRAGISFDDYANDIAYLIKEPRATGAKGDYPDTVYAAFVKSLEALKQMKGGETALNILGVCAFLSPDGVDLRILMADPTGEVMSPALVVAMADKYAREDAVSSLSSLSLLQRGIESTDPVMIFHRLLLEVVRDWMDRSIHDSLGSIAVRLINQLFPYDADSEPSQWPQCARLMMHVAPLNSFAPRSGRAGEALARLLLQAATYLGARGELENSLALTELSVALTRVTKASDPLALATALSNLGVANSRLGNLEAAEQALQEALAMKEPLLESDNPSLAMTNSNLAELYWKRGEYAKAEPYVIRATQIMKSAFGAESAEYGIALSNLGSLYGKWADEPGEDARRTQEAELKASALSVTAMARGVRHPETGVRQSNYAVMLERIGRWGEAASEMERAVAVMLSLDLIHHPIVVFRIGALDSCWEHSGQSEKAARLRRGDISDIIPVIEQIESEHRAWVAQDPENRHFGPPSPITGATS
jgi:tetratricopeptide (TPR) repeat protein